MKKDGHTDVASSLRMCKTIIEDANDIVNALPQDMEASLPTWWTNKLAKCSASSRSFSTLPCLNGNETIRFFNARHTFT